MHVLLGLAAGLVAGALIGWLLSRSRTSAAQGTWNPDDAPEDLESLRSRFLADVSHELRTPLTLIVGNIEAIQQGDTERASYRLEVARRNARRLHRLVEELLELSRVEAGALELDAVTIDLADLVRMIVASFESVADLRDVDLSLSLPGAAVPVPADPDKLEKVLYNLLSNALKFAAGGAVAVSLTREGGWAQIVVEDDGPGISPEALPHIFDRFYRSPSGEARRQEGTGIGLALSKELVELHGGTIAAVSESGRGARFDVRLPLAVGADAPEIRSAGRQSERSAWMPPGGPAELATFDDPHALAEMAATDSELVLIADDNREMRRYIRSCLDESFRIVEAVDGSTALQMAKELVPDLVVADVVMPGLDGYELVQRLREEPLTSHIPVVMLTAQAERENRLKGLESGVDDYVIKPFGRRELHARVANLVALRRLLRERYGGPRVLRPAEVEATPVDQAFLESVVSAIEAHIEDPDFSVETLASTVHISTSQLTRKLRALVDQSPGRLIRSLRLQRAADLLRARAGNVATIAYRVGFSDQAHFSRSFKKQFGVPPSEYRSD